MQKLPLETNMIKHVFSLEISALVCCLLEPWSSLGLEKGTFHDIHWPYFFF